MTPEQIQRIARMSRGAPVPGRPPARASKEIQDMVEH